jgi:hypothetical protein
MDHIQPTGSQSHGTEFSQLRAISAPLYSTSVAPAKQDQVQAAMIWALEVIFQTILTDIPLLLSKLSPLLAASHNAYQVNHFQSAEIEPN